MDSNVAYFIESGKHLNWLKKCVESNLIGKHTEQDAISVLHLFSHIWGYTIPIPAAGTGPDGRLLYSWDNKKHHFEIEFIPGQPTEFFYRNRADSECNWSGDSSNFQDISSMVNYLNHYFVEHY